MVDIQKYESFSLSFFTLFNLAICPPKKIIVKKKKKKREKKGGGQKAQ